MALLILLNNFLHDFSAAGWLFCSLLLWQIMPLARRDAPLDIIVTIIKRIRLFMQLSLVGIVVFGVGYAIAQIRWSFPIWTLALPLVPVAPLAIVYAVVSHNTLQDHFLGVALSAAWWATLAAGFIASFVSVSGWFAWWRGRQA